MSHLPLALIAYVGFCVYNILFATNIGINDYNFHRIKTGMSLSDVVHVVGLKPGVYFLNDTDANDLRFFAVDIDDLKRVKTWIEWISFNGAIHVGFDTNMKVLCKFYVPAESPIPWKLIKWIR